MAKKILNLAHRGFSGKYPENSRIAFEAALKIAGCDGFESDVHFSKDKKLVIIHDPVLDRTTSGKGNVRDFTYTDLLKLDNGSWMSPEFKGQKLMLFSDLLQLTKDAGKVLNIELKNYEVFYDGLEQAVIKEIVKFKMQDTVFISSFNHVSVQLCKKINPEIKAGLLYGMPLYDASSYAKSTLADYVHPKYTMLQYEKKLTGAFLNAGLKVNTWTVNTEADMKEMIKLGVDSIITNYPDLLAKVMKK